MSVLWDIEEKCENAGKVLPIDTTSKRKAPAFVMKADAYLVFHLSAIHQLRKNNFFRTVADGVHGAYPAQLIRCLHFFGDVLRRSVLFCQQRKHFLRLLAELRQVPVQSA